MEMIDSYEVCFCEPFILPGILPTLGCPTLKAALKELDIKSIILYPSLVYFSQNHFYNNGVFLKCINDIPLQFSEFLFNENNVEDGIKYLKTKTEIDDEEVLKLFLDKANDILEQTAQEICSSEAKVLGYSLTFGDYNFAFRLFKRVKTLRKDIIIVVGGSMCTVDLAKEIMKLSEEVDYVLCDEDLISFKTLVQALLNNQSIDNEYIFSRSQPAISQNKIEDLNHLPCPDYSDFLFVVDRLGLNRQSVMVPYEVSRGCWWGEKHPCAMCGYFGYQKCYLIKDPNKVKMDLKKLHDLYGINYIRFTDLVEPPREYLKSIQDISDYNMSFFWELRPNLSEDDFYLLRKMGVFYSQIGLESLSTAELRYIHKGTTAINNIYILILCMTYKLRIDWNYLYGFSEDCRKWYEEAIELFPFLYHLFPPDLRQVWINRESRLFEERVESELVPVGSEIFHSGFSKDMEVFYRSDINNDLLDVYDNLSKSINKWKECFSKGYQLSVVFDDFEGIHILRQYETEEHFFLSNDKALLYCMIMKPIKKETIVSQLSIPEDLLDGYLSSFIDNKIAVCVDDYYLALATRSTEFRWTNYSLMTSLYF